MIQDLMNYKSTYTGSSFGLVNEESMESLNTYKNFGIFPTYNDITNVEDDVKKEKSGTPGVRSLFNAYSAVITGTDNNTPELKVADSKDKQAQAWKDLVYNVQPFRITNNVPLLDTPDNRRKLREKEAISVKDLVEASKHGVFGQCPYSYADFMYCTHLGKVANNHLITLRRFPVPVGDSMMPSGPSGTRNKDIGFTKGVSPIGTMVTWFGVSENKLDSLIKYSFKMPYKQEETKIEEQQSRGGETGILNNMEAVANQNTRQAFMRGENVAQISNLMQSRFKGLVDNGPYENPHTFIDANALYEPIDRVRKIYRRSSEGLDFDYKITLNFDYELRAYNGINPKQAMLDLIASILSVTYTPGRFWRGGYRSSDRRQLSTFSNLKIFSSNNRSFSDFMDSTVDDYNSVLKPAVSNFFSGNVKDKLMNVLNQIGGMIVGGLLNKFGRPRRYMGPSLFSDAPAGLWHITIGNPHRPIVSMGNMILTNTTITHSGTLGLDDFPTKLRVTCEFDTGKPRDQWGIENLYMLGNDRIYYTMSSKVMDMYKAATNYKYGEQVETQKIDVQYMEKSYNKMGVQTNKQTSKKSYEVSKQILKETFGNYDSTVLIWASREQGEGAFKKKSTESK